MSPPPRAFFLSAALALATLCCGGGSKRDNGAPDGAQPLGTGGTGGTSIPGTGGAHAPVDARFDALSDHPTSSDGGALGGAIASDGVPGLDAGRTGGAAFDGANDMPVNPDSAIDARKDGVRDSASERCNRAKFCRDGAVRVCASDGLSSYVSETCTSTQFCDSVGAFCAPQVCSPGQPVCNNQTPTTCASDGSQFVRGGVDCRLTGQTCSKGTCTGAVLVCSPGQTGCKDGVITTCNGDGSAYVATTTDCAQRGLTCWGGQCLAVVVDDTSTSGPSGNIASAVTLLNIYSVSNNRTLLRIGANLGIPSEAAGTTLTWLVYESQTKTNAAYSLVSSTTTTATAFDTDVSSDPLSLPLKAGYFYMIGVSWQGKFIDYTYTLAAYSAVIPTSFGSLLSGKFLQTGEQPGWQNLPSAQYDQRLTTAP